MAYLFVPCCTYVDELDILWSHKVITERVYPAAFLKIGPKHIDAMTLAFQGHVSDVTSPVTLPF